MRLLPVASVEETRQRGSLQVQILSRTISVQSSQSLFSTRLAIYSGAALAGIVVGLFALYLELGPWYSWGDVRNGSWITDLSAGSPSAGLYVRAGTAVNALLALNSSEAVYFFAFNDSEGQALTARCTYTIEGRDPDARWWSVTVYGADGYLLRSANGRYTANRDTVVRRADGSFHVTLAHSESVGANEPDAIPTGAGAFNLTLRLYNPAPDVTADPAHTTLPAIRRTSCP